MVNFGRFSQLETLVVHCTSPQQLGSRRPQPLHTGNTALRGKSPKALDSPCTDSPEIVCVDRRCGRAHPPLFPDCPCQAWGAKQRIGQVHSTGMSHSSSATRSSRGTAQRSGVLPADFGTGFSADTVARSVVARRTSGKGEHEAPSLRHSCARVRCTSPPGGSPSSGKQPLRRDQTHRAVASPTPAQTGLPPQARRLIGLGRNQNGSVDGEPPFPLISSGQTARCAHPYESWLPGVQGAPVQLHKNSPRRFPHASYVQVACTSTSA